MVTHESCSFSLNFLPALPGIEDLDITGSSGIRFDPDHFRNAHALRRLRLFNARLTTVPMLGPAKASIRYWDLFDTSVTCLDVDHISNMLRLEVLNVSENSLTRFPDPGCSGVPQMSHLENISFPSLEELSMNYNGLAEFPLLPDLPYRSVIYLMRNEIAHFPMERISLLSNVSELYLNNNKANVFPDFSQMDISHMEILDISHNRISNIPLANIETMRLIETLVLAKNELTELPDMAFAKNSLTYLSVDNNLLTSLDPMVLRDNSVWLINKLKANGNRLSVIPEILMRQLPWLRTLGVRNNELIDMPFLTGSSTSLTEAILSYNRIPFVPQTHLANMVSLELLDLSHNEIVGFPFWRLQQIPVLHTLTLSHNNLSSLPDMTGYDVNPELHLWVTYNPFLCDYRICWLRRYSSFPIIHHDQPLCQLQSHFADEVFGDIEDLVLGCFCKCTPNTRLIHSPLVSWWVCLRFLNLSTILTERDIYISVYPSRCIDELKVCEKVHFDIELIVT